MSNLTITLEAVPDELVAMASTPEGLARVRAELLDALGMGDEDSVDPETLASLRRGLADIAEGRTYSFEESYKTSREDLIARMKATKSKRDGGSDLSAR